MRGLTRLVATLVFVGLVGAGSVQAQTGKTVREQYGPTLTSPTPSSKTSPWEEPVPVSHPAPEQRSGTC